MIGRVAGAPIPESGSNVRTALAFSVVVALAGPARGQQLAVTLDEAVQRALTVQPAMVQARGAVRTAGAAERTAWGNFLPTVSLNASSNRQSGNAFNPTTNEIRSDPASTAYSGGISASLTLFDGFRRYANRRATGAAYDAAGAGLVTERFDVVLGTKRVFYDALAREELVRVAEAQVRRAEQQREIAVRKLAAGSATRSDSLRASVDLGNARLALLKARADLATARADLGRQIGIEGQVGAVADSAFPELPDTTDLRRTALAASPQVVAAEAEAQAARAQVGVARAQYWPTVTAAYSTSASARDVAPWDALDPYVSNWTFRVSLNWTLFNGFTREANQVAADVQRDNAEARAAEARRTVQARLTQQLAALLTAYEAIEISRATLAAATEDLRVQQERYRVGAATILDLLTSQAALTQAEVSLVQARFNAQLARAEVEALVGRAL